MSQEDIAQESSKKKAAGVFGRLFERVGHSAVITSDPAVLADAEKIVLPGVETPRRGRGKEGGKKIGDLLKPGQEIVVQVVKDPIGTKGARLSTQLSLAGRLLVYLPQDSHIGISQRIEDEAERESLRGRLQQLLPEGLAGGFITQLCLRAVAGVGGAMVFICGGGERG